MNEKEQAKQNEWKTTNKKERKRNVASDRTNGK